MAAWQLSASGRQIASWRNRGLLHRVHRGVYALGAPALTREGRWIAAAFAAGPGAVLSHRSAAVLHGLLQFEGPAIEVTAPRRREIPGVRSYESTLALDEITVVDGIPVTTAARTIVDCAAVTDERALGYALNQLEVRRLYDPTGVQDILGRHEGKRGIAKLRGLGPDTKDLRSPLERRFRREIERRGLQEPLYNAPLALPGHFVVVDALWKQQRLAVELDSRAWHDTPAQFEEDRRRDRALRRGGYVPLRITSAQFVEGIEEICERLGS
ncbi:MAG: DUF559 domain-containing protein [Thermoleophilaceae bacterium]|nr:DUF559 domain-containing protein [Thermoleophilaceae bacterium]